MVIMMMAIIIIIIIIIMSHQCILTQSNTNYHYVVFSISFSPRLPDWSL
jgi:hypothetical protein